MAKVRIRNRKPTTQQVNLDGVKGKQRPPQRRGDGREYPGGIEYRSIRFGPFRSRDGSDIQELTEAEAQSGQIVTGLRSGVFIQLPTKAKAKAPATG